MEWHHSDSERGCGVDRKAGWFVRKIPRANVLRVTFGMVIRLREVTDEKEGVVLRGKEDSFVRFKGEEPSPAAILTTGQAVTATCCSITSRSNRVLRGVMQGAILTLTAVNEFGPLSTLHITVWNLDTFRILLFKVW